MWNIIEAEKCHSEGACNVLNRTIIEVCAPDYNNDEEVIEEWISNKTIQNVTSWIESTKLFSMVCVTGNDNVVGFGLITFDGEILLNYVLPEFLYQGIGKKMLALMEKKMISIGVHEITVTSSITAKPFYERNGYEKSGEPIMVGSVQGDFPLIKRALT